MKECFNVMQVFFEDHQSHVLGEKQIKTRGDRGEDATEEIIKGSIQNLNQIEGPKVSKWNGQKVISDPNLPKEPVRKELQKVSNRTIAFSNNRKDAKKIAAKKEPRFNIDSLKESYERYNHEITQDELDAWLLTHPEDILHEVFKPNKDIEELIDQGLVFIHLKGSSKRYIYRYEYLYGNISKKLTVLHQRVDDYVKIIGEAQYNYQISELEKSLPTRKRVQATNVNERIFMQPHADFAKKYPLARLRSDASVRVYGATDDLSLYEYFILWLSHANHSRFVISNKEDVIKYVKNKRFILPKHQKDDLKPEEQKRLVEAIKENAKDEGNRLFAEFLANDIPKGNQQDINERWNAQYNSLVDSYPKNGKRREIYEKIPVAFRFSKTFKEGFPLQLSEAQRNGVAFFKLKGSALLGYDVGVGKTLTDIACISEAFDSGRANCSLLAVPDATYSKWAEEMAGGLNKKTKKWLDGAIPHINILYWGNLSWEYVFNNVRVYSQSEEDQINKVIDTIKAYRAVITDAETTFNDKAKSIETLNTKITKMSFPEIVFKQLSILSELASLIPQKDNTAIFNKIAEILKLDIGLNFPDLETYKPEHLAEIQLMIQDKAEKVALDYWALLNEEAYQKAFIKIGNKILATLSQERDMLVYTLGEFIEIAPKTIILVNYKGLGRLGFSRSVGEKLRSRFYEILSQGETIVHDEIQLSEKAKREASILKTIDKSIGLANREARLFIDELPVDMFSIDEVHNMKKVFTNVIGEMKEKEENGEVKREDSRFQLNSGDPSLQGIHAFCMSQYIQSKTGGKNILLLSATPFTNSPLEIFSMLSLTNYNFLEESAYNNIHEFFNTFIKERQELVVQPDGSVKTQPTVVGFHNLMELKQLIYHVIDYKTGEDANVIRPEAIHLPDNSKTKKWNGVSTYLKMNGLQKTFMKEVLDYVRGFKNIDRICDLSGELLACDLPRKYIKQLNKSIQSLQRKNVSLSDESEAIRLLRGLAFQKSIALSPYLYGCNELPCPTAKEFVENSPKIL